MDHSDWEAVASVLVLQKMESRQITGASSLPAMLLLSTPAADLASLAKVLVRVHQHGVEERSVSQAACQCTRGLHKSKWLCWLTVSFKIL